MFELHVYDQAVVAADLAITLGPEWDKGYFRKFQALLALKDYPAALQAVDSGLVRAITSITLQKAKQTLQELPAAILQPHKHVRCSEPEQPMQSVEVIVNRLHKAGVHCNLTGHAHFISDQRMLRVQDTFHLPLHRVTLQSIQAKLVRTTDS